LGVFATDWPLQPPCLRHYLFWAAPLLRSFLYLCTLQHLP
jgi:hypothetical protein